MDWDRYVFYSDPHVLDDFKVVPELASDGLEAYEQMPRRQKAIEIL